MCRKRLSSARCRSELIDSAWVVIVPGQKCINKNNKKVGSLNMINNMTFKMPEKILMQQKQICYISVCESNEMREHMEESHFWNRKT